MRKTVLVLLAACLTLILPISAFSADHQKSSWYLSLGAGTGSGNAEGEELLSGAGDKLGPMTFHFGLGAIVNPRLHAGFDLSVFGVDGSYDDPTTYQFSTEYAWIYNYFGAVSFYPFEKGLFFKGGLGLSKFQYHFGSNNAALDTDLSVMGYGFLVGGGLDLWLGKSFNLGVHFEWSKQYYNDSEAPDNTDFYSIYVAFSWF